MSRADTARRDRPARTRGTGRFAASAVIGILAVGAALAAAEVPAYFTGQATAPVDAVGSAVISLTPASVKEFMIAHVGTNDKPLLIIGVLVVLVLLAIAAGRLALRSLRGGITLVVIIGVVGAIAAVTRPGSGALSLLPSIVGTVAAISVMDWLVGLYQRDSSAQPVPGGAPAQAGPGQTGPGQTGQSRRRFLIASAGTAASAALVGLGAGKLASEKYAVTTARSAVRIPRPAQLAATPAGLHPDVPGLSPFFTPNSSFYRVDTALALPQVDPSAWTLRITGMVDHPVEISYDQLLRRTLEEHDMTLSCVSNPVGGPYVGNARWVGTLLAPLLREAGVRSGANQLLATSADGMTVGTPLESVLDGRAALLAVAMNGQPLPVQHGFPCRVLVPGFYGYSSACKWVTELMVTTYQARAAYWVQQGYAQIGTMKIASRIDVPGSSARVAAGTVKVAGIAWATHRGIEAVEVRVDNGAWQQASIAAQDTPDTWRQWTYDWQAQPGNHTLQVRAVDDSGLVQTGAQEQPFPSGATGYHTISVTVA
ncbi:MAG TPA: molybdopterin-dependent oxidoreductase [Streptosporangiaceae bacterium]|nr:molybdopterin-dependent oxidoreductase [Streptosporangiaceae bacterium]